jgi:hypothetical protein
MSLHHAPDLATLLFALSLCAVFGGLFAWVLSVPFWLAFSMVGAGLFALGVQRHHERSAPRRRLHVRASH